MVMTEGTSIQLLHVFKIVTHFLRKIAIWVSPIRKKVPDPKNILFFVREYFITDFKVSFLRAGRRAVHRVLLAVPAPGDLHLF